MRQADHERGETYQEVWVGKIVRAIVDIGEVRAYGNALSRFATVKWVHDKQFL